VSASFDFLIDDQVFVDLQFLENKLTVRSVKYCRVATVVHGARDALDPFN
jgi:hypothetical protein